MLVNQLNSSLVIQRFSSLFPCFLSACKLYENALSVLLSNLKVETITARKKTVQQLAGRYMHRAEVRLSFSPLISPGVDHLLVDHPLIPLVLTPFFYPHPYSSSLLLLLLLLLQ